MKHLLISLGLVVVAQTSAQTLKTLADARGIHIGAAVTFPGSPAVYDTTLNREFNGIVCENAMKFGSIMTGENSFSYTGADAIVNFGVARGMFVRGHNFLWHKQMPSWFSSTSYTPSRDSTFRMMKKYINAVMTHFKGKINEWDIVNEAVARDSVGMRPGTGAFAADQNSKWALLTDAANHNYDYIDSAFAYARRADSTVLLVYNDYDCEGMGKKSNMVYNIVSGLKSKGLVDVIGLQCHFYVGPSTSGSNGAWVPSELVTNFQRLAALGLRISLTEVDVRIQTSPAPDAALLALQRDGYKTLMSICLAQPACKSFFTWGVNDAQSWVPGSFSGYGVALLFDNTSSGSPATFTRKGTYLGVQEALLATTNLRGLRANGLRLIPLDAHSRGFDLRGRNLSVFPYNPNFVIRKSITSQHKQ